MPTLMQLIGSDDGLSRIEEAQLQAEATLDAMEKGLTEAKELQEAAFVNMLAELESDRGMWKPLSGQGDSIRDFSEATHKEISKMAWSAVMTNPVAAREIFYKTVFVSGRGLKVSSAIPEVQKVIDEFWTARRNKIPYSFPMYINRYNIDGEVFFVMFINKDNGHVTLREIEPQEIVDVVCDPDDASVPIYVKRMYARKTGSKEYSQFTLETIWYRCMDVIEHPELEEVVTLPADAKIAGVNDGVDGMDIYVFHFKNSILTNRRRGLSTLTNHLPWLREFKDILRARTQINKGRSAFFLDVSIKEGTENDVRREAEKHRHPPRVGSVNVHTDKLIYQYLTPNIQGADVQSDLSEIKNMSAIGSMLPPDLMGEMGKSNYGNAARTKFPFLRSMEFQQELWEYALKYGIMWTVIWAATTYGKLPSSFKVAKKINISSLAMTQEGDLYDKETLVIVDKKTTKIVREYAQHIMEAAAMAPPMNASGEAAVKTPQGQPNKPMPGGDMQKAEQMMDDYVTVTMSEDVDAIDLIDVSFPRIDTENLPDMAGAFQIFDGMKMVSKQTLSKLMGFDWNKEKEIIEQESAEAMQKMEKEQSRLAGMGPGAGGPPQVGPNGMPLPPGQDESGMQGPGMQGGPMTQPGSVNGASNIQAVLADILNSKGRKDKRGANVQESLAARLFDTFMSRIED